MEFPGQETERPGCLMCSPPDVEVAKSDGDMLGVERDFEIGTNFSVNDGKFQIMDNSSRRGRDGCKQRLLGKQGSVMVQKWSCLAWRTCSPRDMRECPLTAGL